MVNYNTFIIIIFLTIFLVLLADRQKLIIKVSDFGLAKKQERNQFFGSQCGTPNYGTLKTECYNTVF